MVVGVVAVAAAIASCGGPDPIGQEICPIPQGNDGGVFAYSPAVECTSRICLVEYGLGGQQAVAVCTRECSSNADCVSPTRLYCPDGYGCGNVAGYPHAVCVCSSLLDGGVP